MLFRNSVYFCLTRKRANSTPNLYVVDFVVLSCYKIVRHVLKFYPAVFRMLTCHLVFKVLVLELGVHSLVFLIDLVESLTFHVSISEEFALSYNRINLLFDQWVI